MEKMKKIKYDLFYIVVGIGCIILLVMAPSLVLTLEGDNCAQTYALYADVAKALHSGDVSLWNPYLWGGVPNIGNFITQSFYPVNWILCNLFYEPETELVSYALVPCNLILHLSIYFSGMYFLLKRIGFSRLNAFATGVTSALCCSMFSYMYWLVYLDGFCWLPWIFLCAVAMFEAAPDARLFCSVRLGALFAVEASVSVSLMLVLSVFLFGFLFVAYLFGNNRKRIGSNVKYSILAGLLGILLAAPMILSAVTFMKEMVRFVPNVGYVSWGMRLPIEEYSKYVCEPYELGYLLDFHNNANTEIPEISRVSVSAFVLFFGVVGLFCKKEKNRRLYFFSLIGFFICLLACFGIVFPAAFYHVPGLNQLREAIMYGIFVNLFAGILAAYGFHRVELLIKDRLPRHVSVLWKKAGWRLPCTVSAIVALLVYNVYVGNISCILFSALVVCLVPVALIRRDKVRENCFHLYILFFVAMCMYDVYGAMDIFEYTEAESVRLVEAACENTRELVAYVDSLDPADSYYRMTDWGNVDSYPENMASILGFYDVKGYMNPSLAAGVDIHTLLPLNKRAQLQNIKYYLIREEGNQEIIDGFEADENYRRAGEIDGIFTDWAGTVSGKVAVYQAIDILGDAWVVPGVIWDNTSSQKEVLGAIASGELEIGTTAVVKTKRLTESESQDLGAVKPEAGRGSAVCSAVSNNHIAYKVNTGTSGILVTAEVYYPGWEVYVNGERRTLLQVDGTNRGVIVPEGESVVEFRYKPLEVLTGTVVQLMVVIFCILVVCRNWQYTKLKK